MAYTQGDFVRDLAAYSAGAIIGVTRSRKMLQYAAKKGIQLGALGARATPAPIARVAPIAAGTALGLGALQTQPGQDLLSAAEAHARQSRILFERAQQNLMTQPEQFEAAIRAATPVSVAQVVPQIVKRKKSAFNKAVSAGMKTVRASTSYGKKGTINNAKKAFSAVTKAASAVKKGRKAPKSGIRRKLYQSMRRFF
jgi:hypothetical protein